MFKFLVLVIVFSSLRVVAQLPGDLVSSFGNSGKVIVDYGDIDYCEDILLDTSGNVYFAGYTTTFNPATNTDFVLGKLKPSGIIDSTFAVDGFYKGDFPKANTSSVLEIKLVDDGLILFGTGMKYGVADTQFIYVSKVLFDGTLDTTFADSGTFSGAFLTNYNYPGSIDIQDNGKIVVCGAAYDSLSVMDVPLVGRLFSNGQPDTTFSPSGFKYWNMSGPLQDADNLFPNMPEHGAGGFFSNIIVTENGNYFFSGYLNSGTTVHCLIAMVDSNGSFVPNFASNGYLIFQTDPLLSNKIVTSALFGNEILLGIHYDDLPPNEDFVIQAIDTLGSFTTQFNTDFNGQRDVIKDILVHNEKFFLTGYTTLNSNIQLGYESDYFTLAKYDHSGSLNNQFATNGLLEESFSTNDEAGSTCVDANSNNIVVGGYLNNVVGNNITDFGIMLIYDDNVTTINKQQITLNQFTLYPNPAKDKLNVSMDGIIQAFSILNAIGQKVEVNYFFLTPYQINIDVSNLNKGVYFLSIVNQEGVTSNSKFVVN